MSTAFYLAVSAGAFIRVMVEMDHKGEVSLARTVGALFAALIWPMFLGVAIANNCDPPEAATLAERERK